MRTGAARSAVFANRAEQAPQGFANNAGFSAPTALAGVSLLRAASTRGPVVSRAAGFSIDSARRDEPKLNGI
jgi:hypothetical protein